MKYETLEQAQEDYPDSKYLIMSDEEADEAAKESIIESLWAFRPMFLSECTNIHSKVFEALSGLYEDANEPILNLVERTCGINELVRQATSADGRGHFLSTYDSDETEIQIKDETYYVYRTN
jgi:hypothetical protein